MAYIKIRNNSNTSEKGPSSGYISWLDFWENMKDKQATKCEVNSCSGKSELGGHVIKEGTGGKEYILPMCYKCNNKPDGEAFEVWDENLVPVNYS